MRALGYARVSSAEQALGTSLQDQQDVVRREAKKRGIDDVRMFVEAESAVYEKLERREQMRALMSEVRAGDLVLVDKIDRWSRDPEFTYGSIRKIIEAKASFYAVGDDCDPSTPHGDSMLGMRALFAREEHKRIKLRMVGTRKVLRDKGFYVEGPRPYGYRRQLTERGTAKHVLVVDEAEAERVKSYFRMSISGMALSAIASATGDKSARIHKALKNRVYVGEIQSSGGVWIKGQHPPIVDPHTFELAQESIVRRRLGRPCRDTENAETRDWWLRNVARCGCGAKLSAAYGPRGQSRRYYFRCYAGCTARYINVRDAEEVCGPLVVARLDELKAVLVQSRANMGVSTKTDTTARLAKLQLKRDRYVEAFADGAMTRDRLREVMGDLDAERARLEVLGATKPPPVTVEQAKAALRRLDTLAGAWTRQDPTGRRRIVDTLAKAVTLTCGDARPRRKAPVLAQFQWFGVDELIARG